MLSRREINPEKVATSAAVWNVSKWGESQYGDSNGLYQPMLAALDTRNGAKANNSKEALIGVTAIARGLVLVTNDRRQGEAGRELGGEAISFDDFLHLRQSGVTR